MVNITSAKTKVCHANKHSPYKTIVCEVSLCSFLEPEGCGDVVLEPDAHGFWATVSSCW